MAKYNLSYYYKNKLIKIDLSKLSSLEGKDTNSLEVIDKFTTVFKDQNELITYLIGKGILEFKPMYIYITKTEKNKQTNVEEEFIIYKGENLLFSDCKDTLNVNYITNFIETNKKNKQFMSNIAKKYLKKYTKDGKPVSKHIEWLFKSLLTIGKDIDTIGYINLESNDKSRYDECIREFIDFEFYKVLKEGRKINYHNIHNFIEYIKYEYEIIEEKNIVEETTVVEEKKERDIEEFIDDEDIKRDSFLSSYRKPKEGLEIDGKNVSRALYKEELRESYEEYYKKRR